MRCCVLLGLPDGIAQGGPGFPSVCRSIEFGRRLEVDGVACVGQGKGDAVGNKLETRVRRTHWELLIEGLPGASSVRRMQERERVSRIVSRSSEDTGPASREIGKGRNPGAAA